MSDKPAPTTTPDVPSDARLQRDVKPVGESLVVRTSIRAGRLRGNNNSDRRLKRDVKPVRESFVVRTGLRVGRSGDVRGNNNSDRRLKRAVRAVD
jgi:hypothetical protein